MGEVSIAAVVLTRGGPDAGIPFLVHLIRTEKGVFTLIVMSMSQLMVSELPARYTSGVLLSVTFKSDEDSWTVMLGEGTGKRTDELVTLEMTPSTYSAT